jgi:hypothetical protein
MTRPILFLAILTAGCATVQARPVEGPVRLGQAAYVGGPAVKPLKVIEDSRCPINARCIWAGRVVVRAKVSGGDWSRTMDLTLGEPAQVADGALTLMSVTPDREAGKPFDTGAYRFTFDFKGGL